MKHTKGHMGLAAALLLVLSAVPAAMAQGDESAAIIQTSTMAFRVTGEAAGNFSTENQAAFSNQLRSLLSPFNFMSIAVSDYTTGNGYVDVSVRAVDATDAQNLTSTWQTISKQALVSNTFMSTFNALLSNSAFEGNATLLSVNGAASPAGVNVSFAVNVTLSGGMNLVPFMATTKEAFLAPINAFLGDHGIANITAADENDGQVDVTMGVTLDANTMPGFWFFISNQTALQTDLPTLGGSSLKIGISNFTVLNSVSTVAPAPTTTPVEATAPVSSSNTISAPGAPPVSSSSSGTATMNIAMTLYGASMQPFTADKQFAAASSLAGVFQIIVGTGNVNILTFTTLDNVTSLPASTAKGTTQQYGRRLMQAAPTPSATIPAVSVVFQVTLPSASQNSLLVLQSSSDTVKQQFGGWFVTQMAARGYTVDADVTNVALSSISPASPTTPTTPTATPATASGDSTNVGAIVGGVVGGVAAVALVTVLALWLVAKKKRSSKGGKGDSLSETSEDIKANMYWNPAQRGGPSPIYTKDADDLKKTIESELSGGDTYLKTNHNLWESPIYTHMTELDSEHQEGVKRLLHKRRQQESQPLTETSANQAEALLSALSSLEIGSLYYDKYVVEQGQRKGVNSILAYATVKGVEPTQRVVIKFLPDHSHFEHERLFYENRQALEGEEAAVFIPTMLDAFSGSQIIDTADDEAIPPSLVLERGSFTLSEYLAGSASLEGKPEEIDRSQILYNLCKNVEFMHARNLVHGALTPDALMWFSGQQKWKLIGFGNWARAKEAMNVSYDLRHAAPELVLADLGRMDTIAANEATDMWALGCIAFELLAGREIFGAQYSDEEVMSMLIGFVKLPWEENVDFFTDSLPPSARNFVADLLQRSPEARKPIRTVLHSPLFTGDAQGTGGAPNTEALKTPHGIFSTQSEWA